MDTTPHPYFTAKARDALRHRGARDGIDVGPLAEWAERRCLDHTQGADDNATRRGVIVDAGGRLLAETWQWRAPGVSADYVIEVLVDLDEADGRHVKNLEVGLAVSALRRALRCSAVHIRYSHVAQGSGAAVRRTS